MDEHSFLAAHGHNFLSTFTDVGWTTDSIRNGSLSNKQRRIKLKSIYSHDSRHIYN